MTRRGSYRVALGGVLSALALGVMLLGSVFPLAMFAAPAAASLCVLYFGIEYGRRFAAVVYFVISALSLLILPDKEPAFLFALLFGPYPIVKGLLEPMKFKPACLTLKFTFLNSSVLLTYWLLTKIFVSEALAAELSGYTFFILSALLLAGNAAFWLYDIALTRLVSLYVYRLRPRLERKR